MLFVDEAQDLDRTQLDLALLLTGERRDIFLVGDDDQTIYAWRLADVRRVLGLAARLPGLRRVDLETNHRCAPEVVHRAARLVAHNQERFVKIIRASPRTVGSVTLLPDPGDEVARARLLLQTWAREPPGERHAVLARTNRELLPFAAVALELGQPYRLETDGLLLDDARIDEVDRSSRPGPSVAAGAANDRASQPAANERGRLTLVLGCRVGRPGGASGCPGHTPRSTRASGGPGSTAHARHHPRHQGIGVGPRRLYRARRGHLPIRTRPA